MSEYEGKLYTKTELRRAVKEARQDERERIAKALEVARKIDWIFVDKEQRVTVKTVMRKVIEQQALKATEGK